MGFGGTGHIRAPVQAIGEYRFPHLGAGGRMPRRLRLAGDLAHVGAALAAKLSKPPLAGGGAAIADMPPVIGWSASRQMPFLRHCQNGTGAMASIPLYAVRAGTLQSHTEGQCSPVAICRTRLRHKVTQ
ncbi:hypothetical protein D3C81_545080 [compost metagenome]